jgi:hypothetical protein
MMGEPVEQGASEPFRAEDGRPFIERQIAGNHRCTTFIALAEYLEEQFGADGCEWHIAQFIDDQQLDGVEVLLQRAQPAFVARFHELMDESGRGREGDTVTLLAGRQSSPQGRVRFSGAGWP